MARSNFENLDVYRFAEVVSDEVWAVVETWNHFARDTVGKQLVRAADSVGANISEGAGRGSYQENRRFINYARGSLYETKHWLRRAFRRKLLSQAQIAKLKPMLDELAPRLNAYRRSIGTTKAEPVASTDRQPLTTDH
jgi:four helix bundle protein